MVLFNRSNLCNNAFNRSAMTYVLDMGIGWNLGNSLEAYNESGIPSETAWGNPYINKNLLQNIKNSGFKTIRCPVSWMNYIDNNSFIINENWLNRIYEVVNWIEELGLYVIINLHHDGNNDFNHGSWLSLEQYPYENPNWNSSNLNIKLNQEEIRNKYSAVWKQISEKFKNNSDKVIFESANELVELGNYNSPIASTTIPNLNYLNQLFVNTVRSTGGNNTNRILIIAGYNTNLWITNSSNGFKIPNDIVNDKIIVSIHYYDPWDFALNENNDSIYKWGDEIYNIGDIHVSNWGSENYLLSAIEQIKNQFINKNIPVIIGEFGCIDKSSINIVAQEYRRYYLEYVSSSFNKEKNIVTCYWDNGFNGKYGFALFDRLTGNSLYPEFINAILRTQLDTNKEIRKLFSRSILEDNFYKYINNPNFNSNDQKWINFRTTWYEIIDASQNYRNNINLNNLSIVENLYINLINFANQLPI